MDNLSNLPPQCLQSISSFSESPEMPEMTEELPEKSVKRIEEPVNSMKKIARLEANLEGMKKDKDVEMRRLASDMVQIEAKLMRKIANLWADLVYGWKRNRELERKMTETKKKNDDLEAQLSDQNTEVRDGKAKIEHLEGKINALESKISGFETQINRTITFLDLDGSYFEKTASWYKVIVQPMTFDEAEAYCASRKSHLVSIHSQVENDFVQELANAVDSNAGFWIGLKKNPNKGNAFEWTDRSSVDFTNWLPGDPDSDTHAVLESYDGKWGVWSSASQLIFICKRSSQF